MKQAKILTLVGTNASCGESDDPRARGAPSDSAATCSEQPQPPLQRCWNASDSRAPPAPSSAAAAQPRSLLLPFTAVYVLYHFCMLLQMLGFWLHSSSGTPAGYGYLAVALYDMFAMALATDSLRGILAGRFTDAQLKDRYLIFYAGIIPVFQVLLMLLHPHFAATNKNWAALMAFLMGLSVSTCSFPPAHALLQWTTTFIACISMHCYGQHLAHPGSAWQLLACFLTQGPVIAGAGLLSWVMSQVFIEKSSMQLHTQAEGIAVQSRALGTGSTGHGSGASADKRRQRQDEAAGSSPPVEASAGEPTPARHAALRRTPLPFESWGVRMPPVAARVFHRLEFLLMQLLDHVNEEMLVRLVCLPLVFYSLLLCLLARAQLRILVYCDISHDVVLMYMMAWFMVGRSSSNFDIQPLVLRIQSGISASLARAAHQPSLTELVDRVRQHVTGGSKRSRAAHQITVTDLLGQGTFGKVYKGVWRGTSVAVKRMVLPGELKSSERRERMAIMEAAISGALVHPNIVQTYTYTVQSVPGGSTVASEVHVGDTLEHVPTLYSTMCEIESDNSSTYAVGAALEVQLVLEYMDCGTLRDALNDGCFMAASHSEGAAHVNYYAVLETTADVAKGMLHLHSLNVIHCDLKARNVLLRSCASDPRSFTAKVGDFGLSLKLDSGQTCVDGCFHGTPTHMAPEVHMRGRQSKAADVFSFGILMWELYTGSKPFQGVGRALLGVHIAERGQRPDFPPLTPDAFAALAARCWDQDPGARPSLEEVVRCLTKMLALERHGKVSAPVTVLGAQVWKNRGKGSRNT